MAIMVIPSIKTNSPTGTIFEAYSFVL